MLLLRSSCFEIANGHYNFYLFVGIEYRLKICINTGAVFNQPYCMEQVIIVDVVVCSVYPTLMVKSAELQRKRKISVT